VRLKGGDPFVFGRGGEEVEACRRAGVPVRAIPGVTSAISVPAAAGIPVTHRNVSRLFTVVSGHAPLSPAELEHLAGLGGTIVILMGVTNLPSITAGLARFGMDARMPVAVVEQGWSSRQRTTFGELSTILTESARAGVASPAVIIIGEVVGLARGGDAEATAALTDAAAVAGP
jgi:uroporphyrin-III C-methyltransferase